MSVFFLRQMKPPPWFPPFQEWQAGILHTIFNPTRSKWQYFQDILQIGIKAISTQGKAKDFSSNVHWLGHFTYIFKKKTNLEYLECNDRNHYLRGKVLDKNLTCNLLRKSNYTLILSNLRFPGLTACYYILLFSRLSTHLW